MSTTVIGLNQKRKGELEALADQVGVNRKGLNRDPLLAALTEHLQANQEQLSKDPSLSTFFKRATSPVKRNSSGTTVLVESKPTRRRVTKAKEDFEAEASSDAAVPETTSQALAPKTPARRLLPESMPFPPSPAVVTKQIEKYSATVSTKMSEVYKASGVSEYVDNVRGAVSSTASIESIAILIEFIGLINELLPRKTLFMFPAIDALGMPEWPVASNDVFMLITPQFWSAFGLWSLTSVILPLTAAYFFNLALKAKHGEVRHSRHSHPAAQYDPLSFNLSKALVTWLVYSKDLAYFGTPSQVTKQRIDYSVPGGYQGVLVASGIGVITSLYEAALRK